MSDGLQKNKDGLLSFSSVMRIVSVRERKPWEKKKFQKTQILQKSSNFIKGSTEASFHGCSSKNSQKKCPWRGPIFVKLQDLKVCNFIKVDLWHRCFLVKFPKIFGKTFLQNTSRPLLLKEVSEIILKNDGSKNNFKCLINMHIQLYILFSAEPCLQKNETWSLKY